ncbi:MAG TPA: UvrD-helicase domain-containing protein [Syntrophomonadaceae bacterium]|nr:UvrD-helicase domain-containing protein [Syntrophomonadaceae bacterium]
MIEIFNELNHEQKQAVLHGESPCMVLAGAGSGKTKVLTGRIAYLVENGVPADGILAITFTNKAAQEMRNRISSLIPSFNGQWIQTFHAACYRMLRMDIKVLGYDSNFTIVDDNESKALLKNIQKEYQEFQNRPEDILYLFKQLKNSLAQPETFFQNLKLPQNTRDNYFRLFKVYQARLRELNALDFEDLITLTIQIFREHPQVLEKYQNWFRYLMIDEYQDTNYAQYMWAKLLAARNRNIFVVGDPDQSIYSWRGAEPFNLKRFLVDYPEATVIKLEKNYRSTGNILAAANNVIRNNVGREEKELYTEQGEGEKIVRFCAGDSYQEARFVAENITELSSQGKSYKDFAIFYRTHAQSRSLEEALTRNRIPYRIVGARKFYDRKEIRDIMAYLKLVGNPSDLLSFRRAINVPRRGIGEKTLEKVEILARDLQLPILEALRDSENLGNIHKKARSQLEEFYAQMAYYASLLESGASLGQLIDEILQSSGYVEELMKQDRLEGEDRLENLYELRSLAFEYERQGGSGLEDFLAGIALVQDTDELDQSETVFLMTMHGAKGLEFPVVFITGLEEGVFPSYRSESPEEMEEERRLCYVGITRAREKLYLTHTVTRLLYGYERNNAPSRFLTEIPEELMVTPATRSPLPGRLEMGDTVRHRKFGMGVIIQMVEGDPVVLVDFEQGGTKMLRLDLAPLEKMG